MKTVYIMPPLNQLAHKHKDPKPTRNNNCLTLDSSMSKNSKYANHLYFIKLHQEDDDDLHKLDSILPVIGKKKNSSRYTSLDFQQDASIEKNGQQITPRIKKFSKMSNNISPQSTFFIYGRDSLTSGLQMYKQNSQKNKAKEKKQRRKTAFKSQLIGQQKTMYKKPFTDRSFKGSKSLQVRVKEQGKKENICENIGRKEKKVDFNKVNHFTPWVTITQNDFD